MNNEDTDARFEYGNYNLHCNTERVKLTNHNGYSMEFPIPKRGTKEWGKFYARPLLWTYEKLQAAHSV